MPANHRLSASGRGAAQPRKDIAKVARPTMQGPGPALEKSQLRPGDILLLVDDRTATCAIYRAIDWVQWMAGAVCDTAEGDSDTVHAAIWTHHPGNPVKTSPKGPGEPEIVEASGEFDRVHGTALPAGLHIVIRAEDEDLGDAAAQVALGIAEPRHVAYDPRSAAVAGLRDSSFKSSAREQALHFAAQAFAQRPDIQRLFCTQTVIGAYQGAALQTGKPLTSGLALDARRTSPRKLQHALNKDTAFKVAGHIRVRPEDVTYRELPPGVDRYPTAQAAKEQIEAADKNAAGAAELLGLSLLARRTGVPLELGAIRVLGCTREQLAKPLAELRTRGLLRHGNECGEETVAEAAMTFLAPEKIERIEKSLSALAGSVRVK